jgi:hypothetical protein
VTAGPLELLNVHSNGVVAATPHSVCGRLTSGASSVYMVTIPAASASLVVAVQLIGISDGKGPG